MRVWFITGASRGFGFHIARLALEQGDAVVATARDLSLIEKGLGTDAENLHMVELDVTSEAESNSAVAQAVAKFGRIDVLVNNAGRGFAGAIEESSDDEVRATFEVNVFGLLNVTRAALPVFRSQRSGLIINISSIGGFIAGAGGGIYCATKFAVEGISESLQAELTPLGVDVTLVEPGGFRTDFFDPSSMVFASTVIDDYTGTSGAFRKRVLLGNHQQVGDPLKAAAAIVSLATLPRPPLRLVLGTTAAERMEKKLGDVAADLAAWRHVTLSTEFDELT
ncbi:short-chain dehydrogenase/reductase [Rhodococcus sp. ACS1]|uniref:oxidoreductase n=1 Tax=Rhodococcus sp. ACS1 TaxID=2028570 RepID=UPI000BB11052|nr:oxidoreductase [Rhodococcus sp. ACS1]PBC35602.1 short-chain dehydrogenase/reductase [Rhodococcus sp. ACS1]